MKYIKINAYFSIILLFSVVRTRNKIKVSCDILFLLTAYVCRAGFKGDPGGPAPRPAGLLPGWRRGVVVSGVNARRARLQLGLVTVFERVYHLQL